MTIPAFAATNHERLNIDLLDVLKSDNALTVNMTVNPKNFDVKSNDIMVLTPAVISGTDTLRMKPVTVAGRLAWYHEVRNGHSSDPALLRSGKGEPYSYSATVPYSSWMENSTVEILTATSSECNCEPPVNENVPVAALDFRPRRFNPVFSYVAPLDTAEKRFNLSGRADIRFIVNRTNIDWNYADNYSELESILKSVNAVKDNPDASVNSILLTGYASPEGPYANNVRLAKGRTEVVKEYVRKHSSFPQSVYHTSSVPEDWNGLKEWLKGSSLPQKQAMIDFIDDPNVPVAEKNERFMKKFPSEYPFILKNVYPSLRHTDYQITYTVRKYLNVDEIRKVMRTNPRNLSQNELFLLANSCTPGSKEYDEAFDLAATLFPENATANLNAANSAMNRGDLAAAAKYLDRAGNSAEADYARGILAALNGDYAKALPLFEKARAAGIKGAKESIEEINRLRNSSGNVTIL